MLISSARLHWLILGAGLALLACGLDSAQGQNQGGGGGNFNFNSNLTGNFVGGIAIRPDGVIERQSEPLDPLVRQQWLETFQKQKDAALEARVDRRMVSLRGLHAALEASVREGTPLPDAVCFLGGLQRVEYVFLDPERHDVVLAGPGEGWTVDAQGNVVGVSNGQPVLRLEDLIVALRTAENAQRDQGISCSINPTAEGAAALAQFGALDRHVQPGQGAAGRTVRRAASHHADRSADRQPLQPDPRCGGLQDEADFDGLRAGGRGRSAEFHRPGPSQRDDPRHLQPSLLDGMSVRCVGP